MSAFYAMSNNKQLLDKVNKYDIKNYAWVSSKEQGNVKKAVTSFFISYELSLLYYTYIFFNASLLLLVSLFLILPFY